MATQKYFDIYQTDFTPKGVIVVFANIGMGALKDKTSSDPIPYPDYANFINADMQRMRKEPITFPNNTGILIEEKRGFIYMQKTIGDKICKVSKIRREVYAANWLKDYNILIQMLEDATPNK